VDTPRDELFQIFEISPEELARQIAAKQAKGNGQTEWPEPKPLTVGEAETPYPIDALPSILRAAVEEYAKYGQQPVPLIAASALAGVSLVTQGLADVARDEHLRGPLSLYFLLIAVSGERKTSADKWFKSAADAWMHAQCDEMQPDVDNANAAMAAWKAEHDGLLAKIKTASGKKKGGKGDGKESVSVEELRKDLIALEQHKPSEVVVPYLFYEDVNNPALTGELAKAWPSASSWSDEGGLIVGGHGMSDDQAMGFLGLLNRLWDGNAYTRDRVTTRRTRLRGRRFTVSLMAQPIVMEQLLKLAGGASRGMGFIARFLIAWPASTIGQRWYRPSIENIPATERLRQRLRELLDLPLPIDPGTTDVMVLAPPALHLTPSASRLWQHCHDRVEAELGKEGRYTDVADIGAKVAENTARLAGDFHVLDYGPVGEIDSKTVYRAFRIVVWHLQEARRVLAAFDKTESTADLEILLKWLLRQPERPIDSRDILRSGPAPLRDVTRRNAAIAAFVELNILLPAPSPTLGRGAKRYLLNPRIREQRA
jgi:hypothetical protein